MSIRNSLFFICFLSCLILILLPDSSTLAQASDKSKSKSASKKKKPAKEICITFDELPAARGFDEVDREAVNFLILDALKQHSVKAAGFVVGDQIEDSWDILGNWLNNGHTLGSMTYTNQDFNYIGSRTFIKDIKKGVGTIEGMLKSFGQKRRYFRYPFQHYGTTVEEKRRVEVYLDDAQLFVIPATVIPEDYLYNLSLEKLGHEPDSTAFYSLMNEYLNHVLDELERVENLALELFKRPIRQILLLRANRLNAVYIDELLTALESEGYAFISLDRALKDKAYRQEEAYYGMKGLGFLDRLVESNPDLLPAE